MRVHVIVTIAYLNWLALGQPLDEARAASLDVVPSPLHAAPSCAGAGLG